MVLRVARGGGNWVLAPFALATLIGSLYLWVGQPWILSLSTLPFFVGMLMLWFFRDPDRPAAKGIASGADGRVVRVDEIDDPDLGRVSRLSVFMRPHDVHVNRMPLAGDVRRVVHRPGRHLPAFSKDSDRNERVETTVATEIGDIKLIQIAGAVARRIVPYVQPGQHLAKGERMGLIRLSSRFDILVPVGSVEWGVGPGDRVQAGASPVGRSKATAPPARLEAAS